MKILLAIVAVIPFCIVMIAIFGSESETSNLNVLPEGILSSPAERSNTKDQYSRVIAVYGRPERDDSTQYDVPRPPIVTRFIEYQPEGVKIAFVPIAKFGEPPPYVSWNVMGYIDTKTNTKMSSMGAMDRLRGRKRIPK